MGKHLCGNVWPNENTHVPLRHNLKHKQMERPVKIKRHVLETPSTKSYTLKCDWYDKCFSSIDELIEDCLSSGMDPNYDVLEDNKSTGMKLIDYIQP